MSDDSDEGEHRRKRIRQACLNCRRKKVRCGGEKPICTFCSRLSQTCVYAEDGRSQRRTSFIFNGGGDEASEMIMDTITSKVSLLENRLANIENSLQRLEPILSSLATLPALTALPACSMSQPSTRLESQQLQQPTPLGIPTGLTAPVSNPQVDAAFPPTHTLLFAADVFFRFCHNQPYSLFHEPTFRRKLVSGELPEYLIWALIAAARRYSSLPDLQLNASDDAVFYANKAWECIKLPWDGGGSDEENLPVLQAIILIVNIQHPAGLCSSAYMKLGFALRIAVHAKMHMEPDTDLDPIFREERKRTFWSLYLQDKLISLSRERYSVLRDEECRIQLPCSEAAFRKGIEEQAPTLDSFTSDCLDHEAAEKCCPLALIVVLAATLNRVSYYVLQTKRTPQLGLPWSPTSPYASISSTLLELEHYFGLNEDPKDILKQRCYLDGAIDGHLAGPYIYSKSLFHLSHCLLHHPFLIKQRLQALKQKAPPTFIKAAWSSCRQHAKSLTQLKDTKNHNVLVLTSLYGYCTMVAGTIHVLSMNDENPAVREEGKQHYAAALEFLHELSCYWKHAALMANRLERFRQQCENRRADMDPTEQNGSSPDDVKALWQSVDYALLSAPTRPGSPVEGQPPHELEFYTSPSRLFDFADFGMFAEGVDVFGTLPFVDGKGFFQGFDDSLTDPALQAVGKE